MALYTHTHTGNLNKKILISVGILVAIMILLGVFALIFSINNKENESLGSGNEEYNAGGTINGDKGYISSAQIIQTKQEQDLGMQMMSQGMIAQRIIILYVRLIK